jgi:hypothetical protein
MKTKQILWNTMIAVDRLNNELSQHVDLVSDVDEQNDILHIMHLLQEVRTECGIRTEPSSEEI